MSVLMAKLLMTDLLVILCLVGPVVLRATSRGTLAPRWVFVPVLCAPILAIALGVCLIWGIK